MSRLLLFGGSFDPKRLSNLGYWYDASNVASLGLSGSDITKWDDLSGNGNHLVNLDSTPDVFSGGVRFQAGESINRTTAFTNVLDANGTNTLFMVATLANVAGDAAAFPTIFNVQTADVGNAARRPLVFFGRDANTIFNSDNNPGGPTINALTGRKLLTLWSSATQSFIGDGTTSNTAAHTPVIGTTTPNIMRIFAVGGQNTTLIVHEIIGYARMLADPEILAVQTYLKGKWGV